MAKDIEREVEEGTAASAPADSVSQAVAGVSSGMSALVRGHLDLARVEMTRDLRTLGKGVGAQLGGTPILLVGYLLLWVAIGSLLALSMALWVAFLICALANFAIGAVMLAWGRSKVRRNKMEMPATSQELKRDRSWMTELRHPPEERKELRGTVH